MKSNYSAAVRIFKALADENRIEIIKQLQNGEKYGLEILEELSITQPNLSHHMKILCDAGIVESRKEGKWIYYKISEEQSEKAVEMLKEITETHTSGRVRRDFEEFVIL